MKKRKYIIALAFIISVNAYATSESTGEVTANQASTSTEELKRRLDVLAEEVNRLKTGETSTSQSASDVPRYGFGPSASKIYRTDRGLSLSGYGESLYQRMAASKDDGTSAGSSGFDTWDALRAVFYTGYKFNEKFLFNGEIEFEHGSTSKGGEASIEFAYVDAFFTRAINLRVGLVLIPMGFLNELHEPPVFIGARRNDVENSIIPTTWRENGGGFFGDIGPVSYRTYVVNGLDATGFTSTGIRGGRQKGASAKADSMVWVARADWQIAPGLLFGSSGYIGKSGQGVAHRTKIDVMTKIAEGHAEWRWKGLEVRALGVQIMLSDGEALNKNRNAPLTGSNTIGSRQYGYYLQAGYDVFSLLDIKGALIAFGRFEKLNTQASVPSEAYSADAANSRRIITTGVNYLPIDQLVFKLDYQDNWTGAKTGVDQINFAMGYAF